MKISIVGLGYVGLPLAIQFAHSNVTVLGLDIDETKVNRINQGQSYIKHIASKTIQGVLTEKRFCASTDFSRINEVEAVIICVPTPLNKNREPDISFIIETGRLIAPNLSKGALVVLESTGIFRERLSASTREALRNRILSSKILLKAMEETLPSSSVNR